MKNIAEAVSAYSIRGDAHPQANAVPTTAPLTTTRASIAVLPFVNMSGDPDQEYFSDGITEDIITELARFRDLQVIARNSSFQYRAKSVDVKRIGRELGVQYLVEGSARRIGDRIRITAQLIDTIVDSHLWAERYDRDTHDILALQEEVARTIAATAGSRVDAVGRERAVRQLSSGALQAYDLVLRAKAFLERYTRADTEQGRLCAEKAIELDPTNSRAHTWLAMSRYYEYQCYWTRDRRASLDEAYKLAERAVLLDEDDNFAWMILGYLQLFRRRFDEAQSAFSKAMELNPNNSEVRGVYAFFLTALGRPEEAIQEFELAKRQNPFDMTWTPWIKGIAYFTAHRYDEAIGSLKQMRDPANEVRGWLAASYAQLSQLDEAAAMLEEFLTVAEHDMTSFPGRSLHDWEPYWHGAIEYKNQADFDHLFEALRKAGLRE